MICASPWLQSWMLTQWIVGEHHLRLGAEEEICSSMSDLASCLPTNEKSSFYFTHFQVRLPIGSNNRSAAISMWFESIMHIPPTPPHDFKFGLGWVSQTASPWLWCELLWKDKMCKGTYMNSANFYAPVAAACGWWQPCELPEADTPDPRQHHRIAPLNGAKLKKPMFETSTLLIPGHDRPPPRVGTEWVTERFMDELPTLPTPGHGRPTPRSGTQPVTDRFMDELQTLPTPWE